MKLGILGGSFNPVHMGHLFLADKALTMLKLDRVVMIPAFRSPFKLSSEDVDCAADDRLAMLAASVTGDSRIAIDDCEIRREGVSYTADTLEDIITRYMPSGKPVLIIGDDLADEFLKWRNSEKIMELADIAIARRNNPSVVKYPYKHIPLYNEVLNVSSQMVRQRIGAGKDWKSLVPPGTRTIIEDRQLYGLAAKSLSEEASHETVMRVETAVRQTLSTERFLHSRNTAIAAYDLCGRFGLDPMAGYLAGIAHDYAKELDSKLITKLVKNDGLPITELEKEKPNLMHGRAGAVLLREHFNINNKEILDAVAFHTAGSENMGPLSKVIYIADKTEVSRSIDPELRKMCYERDLDTVFFAVLGKTVSKLQSKKLDLSEGTLWLLERMKERES